MNETRSNFSEVASAAERIEPFSDDLIAAGRQYEELLGRFSRQLLAFLATRAPRSDLDDLSQAIWTRLWERRKAFAGGNFRAWMFEISRNYLIDTGRKKRPGEMAADYDGEDRQQSPPIEILLDRERIERLSRCLDRLDAALAELVRGRLRNESYEEIALRLKIESSQAHRRLHHAKQQLRECVSEGEA